MDTRAKNNVEVDGFMVRTVIGWFGGKVWPVDYLTEPLDEADIRIWNEL